MAKSFQSFIEKVGIASIMASMREAVEKAAVENTALGLAEPILIEGVVYCKYPDGRLEKFEAKKSNTNNVV